MDDIIKKYRLFLTIFFFSFLIIALVYFIPDIYRLKDYETRVRFIEYIKMKGFWGYTILALLNALQVIIALLPGEVFEIASGAIFGPVLGLVIVELGVALGSFIIIYLIRLLNLKINIEKLKPIWLKNILTESSRLKTMIFFLTLIPGLPKDIYVYFIAMTDISTFDFLLINAVARIPSILSSTLIGASVINGNYRLATFVFIVELIISLFGILYNKKIAHLISSKYKNKKTSNNIAERNDKMSEIKCLATNCGFNENCHCHKKHIKVEGLFSRSKLGTFCQSFRNPIDENMFKEEMAEEMFNDEAGVKIGCSANYCIYNKDNYCKAKKISIGSKNAKYRSETQCDSFELK